MIPGVAIASCLFLTCVLAQQEINFRTCGDSGKNALKSISATPCDTEPCRLKKGSDVNYKFRFISEEDSQSARLAVTAAGPFDIRVPVSGISRDFCQVIQCPLEKGKEYTGSIKIRIPYIPIISKATVRMSVSGDADRVACFEFPVALV